MSGLPASIAGLPGSSAWVWVGPPLSESGASSGSIGLVGLPMRLPELLDVGPVGVRFVPEASPIRLWNLLSGVG